MDFRITTVFVGGSRRFGRVNADVQHRLERIVAKRFPILVGDANGADKAVQAFLQRLQYGHVEVFCSDQVPRNNLGGWPVRVVRPPGVTRDFDYYATKDRAMANEATVGLMLWDGESRGTLLNVLRLIGQHKTTVVYVGPKHLFTGVRNRGDFDQLLESLGPVAARRVHDQAIVEGLEKAAPRQTTVRV